MSSALPDLDLGPYVVFSALRSTSFNTLALARSGAAHVADLRNRFTASTGDVPLVTFGETDLLWLSFLNNVQLLDAAFLDGDPTYRRADAARVVLPPPASTAGRHIRWRDPLSLFGDHTEPVGTFVALVQLRVSPLVHLTSTTVSRHARVRAVARRLLTGHPAVPDPGEAGGPGAAHASWPASSSCPSRSLDDDLHAYWSQAPVAPTTETSVDAALFLGLDRSELFVLLRARQVDTIAQTVHVIRALRASAVGSADPRRYPLLTGCGAPGMARDWTSLAAFRDSHTLVGVELRRDALAPDGPPATGPRRWQDYFVYTPPDDRTADTEPVGASVELRGRLRWTPDGGADIWEQVQPPPSTRQPSPHAVRSVFGSTQVAVTWYPSGASPSDPPPAPLTVHRLLQQLVDGIAPNHPDQHEGHATSDIELRAPLPARLHPGTPSYPRFRARCLELARLRCAATAPAHAVGSSWVETLRHAAGDVRLGWGLKHRLIDSCALVLARLGDDPVVAAVAMSELQATVRWLEGRADLLRDPSGRAGHRPASRPLPVHRRRALSLDDPQSIERLELLVEIFQGLASGSMAQSMLGAPTTDGHTPSARRVGGRYVIDAHVALADALGAGVGLRYAVPLIHWSHRTRARAKIGHGGSILLELPVGDRLELLDLGVAPAITGALFSTLQFQDFSEVACQADLPGRVRACAEKAASLWKELSRAVGDFVPSPVAHLGAFLSAVGPRLPGSPLRTGDTPGPHDAPVDLRYVFGRLGRGLPALLGHHLLDADRPPPSASAPATPEAPEDGLDRAAADRLYFLSGPVAVRELLAEQGVGSMSRDSVALALLGVLVLSWLVKRRTLAADERPRFDQCLEFVEHTLGRTAGFEAALDSGPFKPPKLIDPELVDRIRAMGEDLGLAGGEGLLLPAQDLLRALEAARQSPHPDRHGFPQRLALWLELVDLLTLDPQARPTLAAAAAHHFASRGHQPRALADGPDPTQVRLAWRAFVDRVRSHGGHPARGWLPFTDRPNPRPTRDAADHAEFKRLEARAARRFTGARLFLRSGGRTTLQPSPSVLTLIDSSDEQRLLDQLWQLSGPTLSGILTRQLAALQTTAEG